MDKTILNIDGMMCGMCESHLNDAVRAAFESENRGELKKVRSSHKKGECEIISLSPLDEKLLEKLKNAIDKTGYKILEIKSEDYVKKEFSGDYFLKKSLPRISSNLGFKPIFSSRCP